MFKRFYDFLFRCFFGALLRKLDSVMDELRSVRLVLAESRSVYVLVTSPNGGVMGQRIHPDSGRERRITFSPMSPLPAGLVISLVGSGAVITDVTIGNMAQLLSFPNELPICITRDPCETGNLIRVGVKGIQ